jgi:hypothetical protein
MRAVSISKQLTLPLLVSLPALPVPVESDLRARISPGWSARAACALFDPTMFDTDRRRPLVQERAIRICGMCPVAAACLASSLLRSETGIWSGTTPVERMLARVDLADGVAVAEVLAALTPLRGQHRRVA